jgi:hypothetical protein
MESLASFFWESSLPRWSEERWFPGSVSAPAGWCGSGHRDVRTGAKRILPGLRSAGPQTGKGVERARVQGQRGLPKGSYLARVRKPLREKSP